LKSFLKFNLNVSNLSYDRSYSLFIYAIVTWRSLCINLLLPWWWWWWWWWRKIYL